MRASLKLFFAILFFCFANSPAVLGADMDDLVVMRDTLRPNSSEADRKTYKTIPWTPDERAFVLKSLHRINALAPGLLPRAASDGTLSVYRANVRTYAKGGTRLIVVGKMVFVYPDFSFRVLLHEMVHAADSYDKLSGSAAFRKIFEPKIKAAQAVLAKEGLTPVAAAALPLGERRKRIERMVRIQTGLPSAYAAYSLSECLAEIVSFWLVPEYKFMPDPEVVRLLSPFVNKSVPPRAADVRFRQAESLFRRDQVKSAIKTLTEVILAEPDFYQAVSARGYAYLRLGKNKTALQDLKRARDLVSPLQSHYAFYDREYQRVLKLVQAGQ